MLVRAMRPSWRAGTTKARRPGEQLVDRETMHDTVLGDADGLGGRDAVVEERQLMRCMRVRSDRDPYTAVVGEGEELDVDVLPIGESVDLDGAIALPRPREDACPIRLKSEAKVVDTAARMREDVEIGVVEGGEVALGLIVGEPQARMKRTELVRVSELEDPPIVALAFCGRSAVVCRIETRTRMPSKIGLQRVESQRPT